MPPKTRNQHTIVVKFNLSWATENKEPFHAQFIDTSDMNQDGKPNFFTMKWQNEQRMKNIEDEYYFCRIQAGTDRKDLDNFLHNLNKDFEKNDCKNIEDYYRSKLDEYDYKYKIGQLPFQKELDTKTLNKTTPAKKIKQMVSQIIPQENKVSDEKDSQSKQTLAGKSNITKNMSSECQPISSINASPIDSSPKEKSLPLNQSHSLLDPDMDELQKTQDRIEREHKKLVADYKLLLNDYNTLDGSYKTLKNDYKTLDDKHEELKTDYKQLLNNYEILTKEVDDLKISLPAEDEIPTEESVENNPSSRKINFKKFRRNEEIEDFLTVEENRSFLRKTLLKKFKGKRFISRGLHYLLSDDYIKTHVWPTCRSNKNKEKVSKIFVEFYEALLLEDDENRKLQMTNPKKVLARFRNVFFNKQCYVNKKKGSQGK